MAPSIRTFDVPQDLTVQAAIRLFECEPFLLVLDSAARHRERDSRYTILTADPVLICRIDQVQYGSDPFATLRSWQKNAFRAGNHDAEDAPPFAGGVAGLMGYELGQAFERLPTRTHDDFRTPDLLAGLFDWAIVWDHLKNTVLGYLVDIAEHLQTDNSKSRTDWALQRIAQVRCNNNVEPSPNAVAETRERTSFPPSPPATGVKRIEPSADVYSNFTRDEYIESVNRVVEYIRAGDIFQANLSQRLLAPWPKTAVELYFNVRKHNPAPFCGLLQCDDVAIVSASPERFLKVDRFGTVETRPIKGTRRRPRSPIADLFAASELASSEKDRSENVMIVDLLRNDLSRSCRAGSVKVAGLCEIERFETVLHLVSTVVGQLAPDHDVWNLIARCFPGGSITGAPKIRAMEIIAELEPSVRGAYCGSLFALSPLGDFDSSILIRTFTLKNGWVQFPVGGGIVADSDSLDEYRETLHKASGMLRSLRATHP
ncbi:MAG: anthranilate synthase component I family protein [Planctomycetota bacterium]